MGFDVSMLACLLLKDGLCNQFAC